MNKLLPILLLFVFVHVEPYKPLDAYGGQLPRYGVTCEAVEVRGSPRNEARTLYDLPSGVRVRLRDQSRPTGEWVMIAPAEWIPLEAVCGY